jgi:hypothetical protein
MGVDFYTCGICAYNFPDCGDYARCGECESLFCSQCMDKYIILNEDDDSGKESTCPFCTLEVIEPEKLLAFALKQLKVTQKQLEESYRAAHKKSKKKK